MKKTAIISFCLIVFSFVGFAQQTSSWNNFEWLIVKWQGEGNGKPGQ